MKKCSKQGCTSVPKRVALDVGSANTSKGISVDGDVLTLTYGKGVGGPRVYMIEEEGVNKNTMFSLVNQEFTFDVDLSEMPCGYNAALYFVGMSENEGQAEDGTSYCDAQAVAGTFCSEMDIMEANTVAQQVTTHACIDACGSWTEGVDACKGTQGQQKTVCDQNGCGLNPFRYGPGTSWNTETNNAKWFGPSNKYDLDSSEKFTVVTQFKADSSGLTNITRFYMQNGKRIDLPTLYVLKPTDGQHMQGFVDPSITEDFCTDIYDKWNGDASLTPLAQIGKNMEKGMVLAMSAWYSQETYQGGRPADGQSQTGMSWLDGINEWGGKSIKSGPCDSTTTEGDGHYAKFSNIRIGDIGTTLSQASTILVV